MNTNNLGQSWIITNLVSQSYEYGGDIPGNKDFTVEVNYTSTLQISTSDATFNYPNTQVTVHNTTDPNVYNITLVWNGLTRTIENVTIENVTIS